MKIHILTLSWNGADKLEKLKPGLFKNLDNLDFIWHIRDNGSKDNTVELSKSWDDSRVKIYEIGHNRGSFSDGVNYLFEQANPNNNDLILLLNNDVIFNDTTSLLNMIKLQRKTSAGVVGARLLYEDGRVQHSGIIYSKSFKCMPWNFRRGEIATKESEQNKYFQSVTAAVCFIKASSFKRVGGMNPRLKWAFDDCDLCLEIGKQDKITYCGQTNITHFESETLKKNSYNKLFLQHNVKEFKRKWWGNGGPLYKIDHDLYLRNPNYNAIEKV